MEASPKVLFASMAERFSTSMRSWEDEQERKRRDCAMRVLCAIKDRLAGYDGKSPVTRHMICDALNGEFPSFNIEPGMLSTYAPRACGASRENSSKLSDQFSEIAASMKENGNGATEHS